MNLNMIMAKEMAKSGGKCKIIHGDLLGTISPDMEWLKWLSYESEFEKKRIEYFDSKKVSELSLEELEEASIYSRNKFFSRLFKLYGTKECSEEDYARVYNYMCNESIEKLMLSKLTSEELQYAKQEIMRLIKISEEELSAKIEEEQKPEKYNQLSMVDSYILHLISNINYARGNANLNREINAQLKQNENMKQKCLYYASNLNRRG